MYRFKQIVLTLSILLYGIGVCLIVEADIRPKINSVSVVINAGEECCFFQQNYAGDLILLEYKVVSSPYQEHFISFQLSDTEGRPLISEFRKASSRTQFKAIMTGAYKVCFDNTESRYSKKVITLRMMTKESKDLTLINWENYNQNDLVPDGEYGGKVGEIGGLVDNVRVNLNEIQELQETFRQLELRDRVTAENNFDRVNWYSALCLFCTVTIMLVQVYSLRSFFEDKSAVQRFIKQHSKK